MSTYKVIFTGPVGAGKTTAIASLSDKPPISTNEAASDMTANRKSETTVAMDYGILYLDSGDALHLYGTPGQERFDFMWDILTKGGLGLMLLLDNRRKNPFGDLQFYLDAFSDFIKETGIVIGITGMDIKPQPCREEYCAEVEKHGLNIPVLEVDARNKSDVSTMLEALLFSLNPT